MSLDYEVRERRLLSNVVSHHEVLPWNETISPQDFLRDIRQTVISFIRGRPQNKIHLVLVCEMVRTDPVTGRIVTTERSAFRSLQEPVYDSTDLEAIYERVVAKILEWFSAFWRNGSGWMFKRIIKLEITFSRNRPVRGSSYIPLPAGLEKTGSLINVQNKKDHHCFKWAILRHIHPREVHPERISDLKEHVNELNWGGIEFPTPCLERMYKKFEKSNNISLLVFGHEIVGDGMKKKTHIIPFYVPMERYERVVRLFFYKNKDGESHYRTIANMLGLVSKQVIKH